MFHASGKLHYYSHLASDVSLEELHAFAERAGLKRWRFHRDHYDVSQSLYDEMIAVGAAAVSCRELMERLTAAGLRRKKPGTLRFRDEAQCMGAYQGGTGQLGAANNDAG